MGRGWERGFLSFGLGSNAVLENPSTATHFFNPHLSDRILLFIAIMLDTTDCKSRLEESLRQLKRTFANYRGEPNWVDACANNNSSITQRQSAFELSYKDYQDFAIHSQCMVAEESQLKALKYFLPRVAHELTFGTENPLGSSPWLIPELASYLVDKEWQGWKTPEVTAIKEWSIAWFYYRLVTKDWKTPEITEFGIFIGIDINSIFKDLRKEDRILTAFWVASEIRWHYKHLLKEGWPSNWRDYWSTSPLKECSPPKSSVVDYLELLLRKSSRAILEETYFNSADSEIREMLSDELQHAEMCIRFGSEHPESPLAIAVSSPSIEN